MSVTVRTVVGALNTLSSKEDLCYVLFFFKKVLLVENKKNVDDFKSLVNFRSK